EELLEKELRNTRDVPERLLEELGRGGEGHAHRQDASPGPGDGGPALAPDRPETNEHENPDPQGHAPDERQGEQTPVKRRLAVEQESVRDDLGAEQQPIEVDLAHDHCDQAGDDGHLEGRHAPSRRAFRTRSRPKSTAAPASRSTWSHSTRPFSTVS